MTKFNKLDGFYIDLFLLVFAAIILIVDINVPLGVVVGVPYVAIIVLASITKSSQRVVIWAGLCSFLTVVGYYTSPLGVDMWKVIVNQLLTIFAIWCVVGLHFHFQGNGDRIKELEKEVGLADELSYLGLVAKYAKDAVIITDKDGLVTWVNNGFVDISGYTLEEVKGHKPSKYLQGHETSLSEVRRISEALMRGEQVDAELINYHKDGSKYWIEMSISPVYKNGEVDNFIAVERDITYKKELEQNLLAQGGLAAAESAIKSHILNVYRCQVGEMFKVAEVNGVMYRDGNALRYLQVLNRFNDLLLHQSHLDDAPVGLGVRVQDLLDVMAILVKAKGYVLKHSVDGDLEGYKVCEASLQYERFLIFVLFTLEPIFVSRELDLHIQFLPRHNLLNFDIELLIPDGGKLSRDFDGISSGRLSDSRQQSLPELFRAMKTEVGAGFGYSVFDQDGVSKFSIKFDMSIKEVCSHKEKECKVLIAEDNKVNGILLSKLLNSLGYDDIDIAEDGAKVIEMAERGSYSIILMDNHMPEFTGIQATKVILQDKAISSSVVACTADSSPEVREEFLRCGAHDVLLKPIKKEQLRVVLERLSPIEHSVPVNQYEKA
ncbi:PAS domain S-box protein [Vibrio parahaemolyticus]|nr:PAS domain S-box protein [Vibrio parahaemolyticus]